MTETNLPTKALALLEEANEELRAWAHVYARELLDALELPHDTTNTAAVERIKQLKTLSRDMQALAPIVGVGSAFNAFAAAREYVEQVKEIARGLGVQDMNVAAEVRELRDKLHTSREERDRAELGRIDEMQRRGAAEARAAEYQKALEEAHEKLRQKKTQEDAWGSTWMRMVRAIGFENGATTEQMAQAVENTCLRLKMKEQDFTKCWADVCTALGLPANETRDNVVKAIGRMRVAEEGAREAALGALDEVAELREQTGCSNCGEEFGKCVCPEDDEPKHCGDNVFYPNHARVGHCMLPDGHEGPHREHADLLEDLKVNVLDRMKYVLARIEDKRGDYYCGIESAASWVGDWIVGELPPFEAPKPHAPASPTEPPKAVIESVREEAPALVFELSGPFGKPVFLPGVRVLFRDERLHAMKLPHDVDTNARFYIVWFWNNRSQHANVQVRARHEAGKLIVFQPETTHV